MQIDLQVRYRRQVEIFERNKSFTQHEAVAGEVQHPDVQQEEVLDAEQRRAADVSSEEPATRRSVNISQIEKSRSRTGEISLEESGLILDDSAQR